MIVLDLRETSIRVKLKVKPTPHRLKSVRHVKKLQNESKIKSIELDVHLFRKNVRNKCNSCPSAV